MVCVTSIHETFLAALSAYAHDERARFNAKLVPTIAPERFMGVSMSNLRKTVRNLQKDYSDQVFLAALPHPVVEADLVHMMLLNEITDADIWEQKMEEFLPYVDNWMVADAVNPRVVYERPESVRAYAYRWLASGDYYSVRVGVVILLLAAQKGFFVDEDMSRIIHLSSDFFRVGTQRDGNYYVTMACAWYLATVFEKEPLHIRSFLEGPNERIVLKKYTLRKILESRKTSNEDRIWLKELRLRMKTRNH
nr:DNA alkylation repair protein [Schaalia sp. lx-100]